MANSSQNSDNGMAAAGSVPAITDDPSGTPVVLVANDVPLWFGDIGSRCPPPPVTSSASIAHVTAGGGSSVHSVQAMLACRAGRSYKC